MDFFEAQDRSRRKTRSLIILFAIATIMVAGGITLVIGFAWFSLTLSTTNLNGGWMQGRADTLLMIAIGTLVFIGLASLYRTASLRQGGARVARDQGGSPVPIDTDDPLRRRLRNVVEEMALASGIPVPDIFVLEQESGINAFAAGFAPEDAVIAVTRGALENLDRDELQGVVAHEFSHILNGDMRLNIRLMGPLFGILALGMLGRTILRHLRFARIRSSSRSSAGSVTALLVVGVGLSAVGAIGIFFARLIKAGVSREREYLADASAVQFTRQASGISGALKKIAGLAETSCLSRVDSEEINHMLFASGRNVLVKLFATHPPLLDRIHRLDPQFSRDELVYVTTGPVAAAAESAIGFTTGNPEAAKSIPDTFRLEPDSVVRRIGNPDDHHIHLAAALRESTPERLQHALRSTDECLLLGIALALHPNATSRRGQLKYLARQLGPERADVVEELFDVARQLGSRYRLPILELAFPAIKDRPDGQLDYLRTIIGNLIHADHRVEFFEYAFAKSLDVAIHKARFPGARLRVIVPDYSDPNIRRAMHWTFAVLAISGHDSKAATDKAFRSGLRLVNPGLLSSDDATPELTDGDLLWVGELDAALDLLRRFSPRHKRKLIEGLTATASSDGRITVIESELLRMLCAVLDCPVPPLYVD